MELLLLRPGLRRTTQGHLRAEEHDQRLLSQVPCSRARCIYANRHNRPLCPSLLWEGKFGLQKGLKEGNLHRGALQLLNRMWSRANHL